MAESREPAWMRDYCLLRRDYGRTWEIHVAPGDPYSVIATREHGSEIRVIAGAPGDVLTRIDRLPKGAPGEPVIIRHDVGLWISGGAA